MVVDSKTFYIFHDNNLVPVKFPASHSIEDVRIGVNDALKCLDKVQIGEDELFSVRSMSGQLIEPDSLHQLDGNEFFLDTGDQSWKYAQIIHSKLYGPPSVHEEEEEEEEEVVEAEEEVQEEPEAVENTPAPEPVEIPEPEVDPDQDMKDLKKVLSSSKGMSIQKISRNGKVVPRTLTCDKAAKSFTVGGGKAFAFTSKNVELVSVGKHSPEAKKKAALEDSLIVCVKLNSRYLTIQFADKASASSFQNSFQKLVKGS
eukprot:GHVL01000182.1.p1 GENE.GHVL01000182.1~~GHVL01000182.1.p1  ORF type:complete len:258 (+),score=50.31 GHVL01000182.1:55-828(+)